MREPASIAIHAPDVEAMRRIGATLASAFRSIDAPLVVALEGELGAGKTTLVSALLNAFGFDGNVRSPTYTLVEPYELDGRAIYHMDLYRLTDPREVEALGVRDLQEHRSILLIEWPERGAGALPAVDLSISIEYAASVGRRVLFKGVSNPGRDTVLALMASAKP